MTQVHPTQENINGARHIGLHGFQHPITVLDRRNQHQSTVAHLAVTCPTHAHFAGVDRPNHGHSGASSWRVNDQESTRPPPSSVCTFEVEGHDCDSFIFLFAELIRGGEVERTGLSR